MDVDLRKLRYFVAVARHLHFGRAAAELHVAQPVLSRQIRALESELHVQLFRRDRRTTELTEAGQRLLDDAVPLLASAAALQRRVARAFVVAFMPGLIVTEPVRRLQERHPGLRVDVLRTTWDDQVDVLRDGRADVSYLRLPAATGGLDTRPALTEPRVVALPAAHPLADRPEVSVKELAGDTLLQHPDAVPEWRDVATVPAAPALTAVVEEKLENVAAGRGIAVVPASTAAFYHRCDVVYVPVTDIADNEVVLAWSRERRDPLLAEFALISAAELPRRSGR